MNVLLAYGNRIDDATLSGGSWLATLPLSNLKNEIQGLVGRTSNTLDTSTKFDVDLGEELECRTFAVVAHNMGLDDLIRIRASDSDDPTFAAPLFDSGWVDAWPAIYDSLDLPWEHPEFWSGQPSAEQRAGYNPTKIVSAPSAINPRYIRFEANVSANPDGYWQVGRPFAGPAFEPEIGMSNGQGIKWEDPSTVEAALDGTETYDRRAKTRLALFSTDFLTEDEALEVAFELQRRVGITDEVIYQRDPADTKHAIRTQFMGRLSALDNIANPSLETYATAWQIKEKR